MKCNLQITCKTHKQSQWVICECVSLFTCSMRGLGRGGHYLQCKHELNEVRPIIITQHSLIIMSHRWKESDSEKIAAFSLHIHAFAHLLYT